MTPGGSAPQFRIVAGAEVMARMRALAERSAGLRLGMWFADVLRTVWGALESDPLGWGDPYRRLANLDLLLCLRVHEEFSVHYGVNEAAKVVWIQEVKPVLNNPLIERRD
jgi:hypothetical protein